MARSVRNMELQSPPKILAFIPARSGSKRLKNKNIFPLGGKPLIDWTIQCVIGSRYSIHPFVSTDSVEIAAAAKSSGASVPFLRSVENAEDTSITFTAFQESYKRITDSGQTFDVVVVLQPTSPLRLSSDLDAALDLFFSCQNPSSVISFTRVEHPIEWTHELNDDGISIDIKNNFHNLKKRSQDFDQRFRVNGAIYISRPSDVLKNKGFYIPYGKTLAYLMPWERSVDIDTADDLLLAEYLMFRRDQIE
jgi:CMP-N,N'-diacetyllegionaminic acid synthase